MSLIYKQTMIPKLKISIENLYDVFSKYPGKSNMQGSSNYDDLEIWNKELLSKSLKDLSPDDLSRFVGKAMTTWGDADDYKHFLPRIFELTAELNTPYEIWIAFDKLEYANWSSWEENEKNSIFEYMLSLWDNLLKDDSEKAEWFFMDYFSSIAHFYPTFGDIIEVWEQDTNKASTKHLASFIFNERENIFDKGYIDGFHKKSDNIKELINWLLADKTILRLEKAFYRFEQESFSESISWAEKILSDEKRNTLHKNGH